MMISPAQTSSESPIALLNELLIEQSQSQIVHEKMDLKIQNKFNQKISDLNHRLGESCQKLQRQGLKPLVLLGMKRTIASFRDMREQMQRLTKLISEDINRNKEKIQTERERIRSLVAEISRFQTTIQNQEKRTAVPEDQSAPDSRLIAALQNAVAAQDHLKSSRRHQEFSQRAKTYRVIQQALVKQIRVIKKQNRFGCIFRWATAVFAPLTAAAGSCLFGPAGIAIGAWTLKITTLFQATTLGLWQSGGLLKSQSFGRALQKSVHQEQTWQNDLNRTQKGQHNSELEIVKRKQNLKNSIEVLEQNLGQGS